MSTPRPLITAAASLALLAGAAVLWVWPETAAPRPDTPQAHVVAVGAVTLAVPDGSVRFPGTTRSARRAAVAFSVPGRLATRPVDAGSRVSAGQVLATLVDDELRNNLLAAEALVAELDVRLSQARRDRERVVKLAAARAATAEELEVATSATAALEASREAVAARRAEAQRQLRESVLSAPFAATVTAVHLEPGEWASPGRAIVELAGTGALELAVELPETFLQHVAPGDTVQVALPFSQRGPVTGEVVAIAHATAGPGHLFPVLIRLEPASGVVAGMTAELLLPAVGDEALSIPLRAVINPGSSRPFVFRLRGNTAESVPIEVGPLAGERVFVRAPLAAGDQVVVAGHTTLADGDRVEVR